jgi:hypothetical protein
MAINLKTSFSEIETPSRGVISHILFVIFGPNIITMYQVTDLLVV